MSLFRDDLGEPVGFLTVVHNITAKEIRQNLQRAQLTQPDERLAPSENRYRSLVRASSQIVWRAPAHGAQTSADMPEWQAITGQTN